MSTIVQQLLNGLTLGSTYALMALGVAMVFSILSLANFAHGELLTICGYVMLGLRYAGAPWIVWVVAGVAAATDRRLAMERLAFRPMRHAIRIAMMVASLGLSILISYAFEAFVSAPGPRDPAARLDEHHSGTRARASGAHPVPPHHRRHHQWRSSDC